MLEDMNHFNVPIRLQQELWQLGGLSRPCFTNQHDSLIALDQLEELFPIEHRFE